MIKHSQKVEDGVVSDEHVGLLGRDQIWEKDIISIAGNHDRGSAGDIIEKSAQRFEKVFGKVPSVPPFKKAITW